MTRNERKLRNETLPDKIEEVCTIDEFSKIQRIKIELARKLCQEGQVFGAYKIGSQWRIHLPTFYAKSTCLELTPPETQLIRFYNEKYKEVRLPLSDLWLMKKVIENKLESEI